LTTHSKKLTTETTCLLSQILSKNHISRIIFTSNVQCVRLAAGRRTQAGDANDQWCDQPKRCGSLPHSVTITCFSWLTDVNL